MAFGVIHPGAAKAQSRPFQPRGRGIAGGDLAPIAHGGGHGQRLAPGAGAVIRNPHPRARIGQKRDQLAAFILHFNQASLEGGRAGDRAAGWDA
jgi:hypothetical protein